MKITINKIETLLNSEKSQLVVLGGRPNMGKSTIALDIITELALKQKIPTLYFNLETSKETIINTITKRTNLSTNENLHIIDTPNISIQEISKICREMKLKNKIKFVFIDYLQLVSFKTNECLSSNVQKFRINNELKQLANELNITIFALSQLTNSPDKRTDHRPILSDLGNNELVENADVVMLLYRESYYNKNTDNKDIEIAVVKNNYGKTETIKFKGEF